LSASPDLIARLFRLDGQVAVVTGGMGRLGRQYVRALVAAGASVAIFDLPGHSHPDIRQLIDAGQPVASYPVDATDRSAVDQAIRSLTDRYGVASVLVNNAGVGASPADAALETGPFETYPESAWDVMIESHLKSALIVSQSFVAEFNAARRHDAALTGSIINVSSTYGLVSPDQSVYEYRRRGGAEYYKPVGYSVAKSGMLNFTRWLAEYGAPLGLRVNTLVPGGVRESAHAPEFVAAYEQRTPLGRMAAEDDYNGAVLFLASRASAYMTGAMLVVDGGWTMR
jgi:NAD(P)-dependent dehydrogenase (short-subunit alcohol dehydrogenase family)